LSNPIAAGLKFNTGLLSRIGTEKPHRAVVEFYGRSGVGVALKMAIASEWIMREFRTIYEWSQKRLGTG
jgi:hypothetical protein